MPESLHDRAAPPARATVPGPHLGLSWRALTPADLDQTAALSERCEAVDQPVLRTTRDQLADILKRPGTGMNADSLGGFDGAGQLRAAAFVHRVTGLDTIEGYFARLVDGRVSFERVDV